ncbi:MAG: glyoxylate/hydroxypyruvate reductase A [Gammaproteobacteria bacterium]|nr:glyoxylate/hydroxypyruvate reductase A [Gammaproteobacteria bacterium]
MQKIIPFTGRLTKAESQLWITALQQAMTEFKIAPLSELSELEAAKIDVAIVANPDPNELTKLKNLKWIHSVWAGVEGLLQSNIRHEIDIVRLIDSNLAQVMSEAALAATMFIHRDMPLYQSQQTESIWHQHKVTLSKDRNIGILGIGELGLKVGQNLVKNGFQVAGWGRSKRDTSMYGITTMHGKAGLKSLLQNSEILIILLPLTPDTRGLMNDKRLTQLPQGASVINFARGPILEEKALLRQLDSGYLAHAVLDVFDQEPLPSQHPYWSHNKITVWPHIAAPTDRESAARIVSANIRRYFESNQLPQIVDRENHY